MSDIVFSKEQIEEEKVYLRKKIFYLLLLKDPNCTEEFSSVDIEAAFSDLMDTLAGLNLLFGQPVEILNIAGKLSLAHAECEKSPFNFKRYRKLILDAGNLVLRIGGDRP